MPPIADAPWPLLNVALACGEDRDALEAAARRLTAGDPSFAVSLDVESGFVLLHGPDEAGLDAAVGELKRDGRIAFEVGAAQVAYREVLGRTVEIERRRETGARLRIRFEPATTSSDCVFETAAPDLPPDLAIGVRDALEAAARGGLLAGYPVIGLKAVLIAADLGGDTPERFLGLAYLVFSALREQGAPYLAEPIVAVEVETPDPHLGAVVGDLNGRRAMIESLKGRDGFTVVAAQAPLVGLFGHADALDALGQGRIRLSTRYHGYAPVPRFGDDDPTPSGPALALRA